jgi:predicted adenylyl cyclase CyaB
MEIEAKVRLKKPSKLRASLKSVGAIYIGRTLEKNWLYDYPERGLMRADKLLRVRQDVRTILTFKGPREQSEFKKREELQMEFPDVSHAKSLLEAVGFVSWFYYEKIRETWRLGACEVVLDDLPELGLFVEVEAATTDGIESVIKKLKLKRELISLSYVELFQDLLTHTNRRAAEFKFSPGFKSELAS